ncbi:hypothetical protein [Macrococcus armenti]|uniref:hypothetical protein n=1 Tax=Macrococcus armenti TaxID=2875764 RepID=UPI001CCBD8ED|nr:hypothetical protein [Macrococcus armenti]UBH16586.1 hypothetical protein LAU44_12110 [Macrococcus armenti]UBH21221.1 hypothetical protein LAU40_12145 [Macrococcus armenti]
MFNPESIYFHTMSEAYFEEMSNIDEFQENRFRGHGIMLITISELLVAIPIRSKLKPHLINAKHVFPYRTYINDGNEYLKGMDFSKITIIEEYHVNKDTSFEFSESEEKQYYIDNFSRIRTRIKNYINGYIKMCEMIKDGQEVNLYTLKKYRYTTLRNFHSNLNISLEKEEVISYLNERLSI